MENDIYRFISSVVPSNIDVKQNDRTILNGKELDIYIPFKKIAYEINGLYWHSENGRGVKKRYHLNKYKSCLYNKIRLIHIFENEWVYKKDIVKSIIRNSLGCVEEKIYARLCDIKPVAELEKVEFLNSNHIQGNDQSKVKYGLYYGGKLVSMMTFGISRFDKKIQWEIVRFCNKLNTSVVGGAAKLYQHFIKKHNPSSVVSYCDKRFFTGNLYINIGMKQLKSTPPNYFYFHKNKPVPINRQNFQKHKLKKLLPIFDIKLTEWQNMQLNGYDRIWDCGHLKYEWSS